MIKMKKIILKYEDFLGSYRCAKSGIKASARYQKWFPIKSSEELSGLVADLMGDGHLQGDPKWRFDYCSKSI